MDDKEMAKYPGLSQRGGIWQVRVVVPKRLQRLAGRRDFRESLGTSDRREAIGRYRARVGQLQAKMLDLDREFGNRTRLEAAIASGRLDYLSHAEIETLVGDWWERRADFRAADDDEDRLPDTPEEVMALRELEGQLAVDRHGNDPLDGLIGQMLAEAGFPVERPRPGQIQPTVKRAKVDKRTSSYAYLRSLVERALLTEEDLAVDVAAGTRKARKDPLFNPDGTSSPDTLPERPKSVEDLIRAYKFEREVKHGQESTARKFDILFRAMRDHWGPDLPVRHIKREHITGLVAFIRDVPPNATKRFRGMSLKEAIAANKASGGAPLAPMTASIYVQNLLAVLRWAENQDWLEKAPIKGLHLPRNRNVKRRGYRPEELHTLFSALAAFREEAPSKFWVPALALYSGARAGELCQLNKSDVIRDGGRLFLDFSVFDPDKGTRIPGKRLKTESSDRMVPIHPDLIAAGFGRFVESRPDERLFPELKLGPKGNYSHNLSKWYGRFRRSVGLTQPSLVLHSFRHGFRDACDVAGVPARTAEAMGGWATLKTSDGYGRRDTLAEAIKKIAYGDFSLAATLAAGQKR